MRVTIEQPRPLVVYTTGALNDAQFVESLEWIHATAVCSPDDAVPPEVIVIAQSRPGEFSKRELEAMRRRWPLAGVVTLCGSWCEGEVRTGRPWAGVHRLFWYEFPTWWQQQIALRSAGLCPAWSRPVFDAYRVAPRTTKLTPPRRRGLVVIRAANRDSSDAIGDMLCHHDFAVAFAPHGNPATIVRGASCGIWDGSQLDDREASDLGAFAQSLSRDGAPVIALLDFPRIDRYSAAIKLGAAAVLGKPWINADLAAMIQYLEDDHAKTVKNRRRAA
jgi:hypothetical protein